MVPAEAIDAHKAEEERLRLAMLDQERSQKGAPKCAETDHHASLYPVRQKELSRKMQEEEAAEVTNAEAFTRQRDVAAAKRLAVFRKLELMHQDVAAGVPPLGSFHAAPYPTLLPLRLSGSMPHISLVTR